LGGVAFRGVAIHYTGAILAATVLVGCDGLTPKSFDPNKGFLDPSEVSVIRSGKQPLTVPILDKLDPSIEEDDAIYGNSTEVREQDLIPTTGDYRISKSDLLQISITDLQGPGLETIKQTRVSESGKISLPLIGQIEVDGQTEAQIETLVASAYRDKNIIQNAQVSVVVAEQRGRTFSIIGSVAQAGQYAILKNDFRLIDALVLARDLTVDTDIKGNRGIEFAYILRKVKQDDEVVMPGNEAVTPTTGPQGNPDVLAPRSDAGKTNWSGGQVFLMQDATTTPAPGAAPAETPALEIVPAPAPDAPAPDAPAPDAPATAPDALTPATGAQPEGRYVIIDGKPVLVGADGQPTTAPSDTDAMAPMSPLIPMDGSPTTSESPSTQGFAFNEIKPVTDTRVIRVPLARLKDGDLRYNIVIRPDDVIVIRPPVQGEYYMGGHVNRVGVYSLTARKITLTQAVISAGMLDAVAVPGRTEIRRRIGADQIMICRVDLEKIFAGQQADIFLKPEDEVIVGTNAVMPFIAAIRGGFRVTYGFGWLYDRNYAQDNQNNNN